MWSVLPLLLVFAALLVVLTVVVMRIAGRTQGRTFADRERDAEHIMKTGTVPDAWIAAPPSPSAADRDRTHADVMKRLDELCRYYERMRVPEDAGSHALLLSTLRRVRAEWANRDIDSLVP